MEEYTIDMTVRITVDKEIQKCNSQLCYCYETPEWVSSKLQKYNIQSFTGNVIIGGVSVKFTYSTLGSDGYIGRCSEDHKAIIKGLVVAHATNLVRNADIDAKNEKQRKLDDIQNVIDKKIRNMYVYLTDMDIPINVINVVYRQTKFYVIFEYPYRELVTGQLIVNIKAAGFGVIIKSK